MKCPVCKEVTLLMMDKNGIEIDYCPQCRGVWLDRGELEKLVSYEKKYSSDIYESYEDKNNHHQTNNYNHHDNDHYNHKRQKKKSFFESFDIFD